MTGQHAGNVQRIQVMRLEVRGNHLAGFQLIGALNFPLGEIPGAGNGPINVIGMGGARGGNVPARLGPDGCPAGVRMDNACLLYTSRKGLASLPVSVNFSRFTLSDPALPASVLAIQSQYPLLEPGLV